MAIIDIINSRTNSNEKMTADDDLVLAKYRLMYAMDMLFHEVGRFDYYLFMNKRNNLEISGDYSFIEKDIFYFIDEIFEYNDKEIANSMGADYDNTIKSILIEAYYILTKDERVIEAIKQHPNYGKHHFVTGLFNNIINKNKRKIKRKEDE